MRGVGDAENTVMALPFSSNKASEHRKLAFFTGLLAWATTSFTSSSHSFPLSSAHIVSVRSKEVRLASDTGSEEGVKATTGEREEQNLARGKKQERRISCGGATS